MPWEREQWGKGEGWNCFLAGTAASLFDHEFLEGLQTENPTPKHPRCEKKKRDLCLRPFMDKDKRLVTKLDALNRTHEAVISYAEKKEVSEGSSSFPFF